MLSAAPAAAQNREAWEPPTLTTTRYDEDWSVLSADPKREQSWTDPLKYIPLSDDAYLTTGVELRVRNENYRNNLWGSAAAPNDGFVWTRFIPHADLHVGRVRVFVQPIAAFAAGVAPSAGPIDQTRTDMLQAFADFRLGEARTGDTAGTGVTIRVGRQMIALGTERLVGTRYGPNVPLAFDGARALASLNGTRVTTFVVSPVQSGPRDFDDRRSRTKLLWGAYANHGNFDLYYLGFRNRAARFEWRSDREERHTIGTRFFGNRGEWHWNAEGAYQFGDFGGETISAWTAALEVGRRFPDVRWTPDATIRINMASGDHDPNDQRLGTFNAMFPKGKYFGELSPVGPYNIVSINPRVSTSFSKTVSGSLAGMAYWRQSTRDGVYDIPGNLIRAAGASRSRFIGGEVEASVDWQATPELGLSTSLSAFAPGEFIQDTGPARTIVMLGLEANFRF